MVNHPRRGMSRIIKFTRDDNGDYRAEVDGIALVIWRSTRGFGYSAIRMSPHVDFTGPGIRWVRTKRNCVEALERIVERERALRQNIAEIAAPSNRGSSPVRNIGE